MTSPGWCNRVLLRLLIDLACGSAHMRRLALLPAAGFRAELQQRYLARPRVVGYHYWGEAVADAPPAAARSG